MPEAPAGIRDAGRPRRGTARGGGAAPAEAAAPGPRPRLGVLCQYLDLRADFRKLVEALADRFDVVLLVRAGDPAVAPDNVTVRPFSARRRTWRNLFLERLRYLIGRRPRNSRYFLITELFKIHNSATHRPVFKAEKRTLIHLSRVLPHVLSYDRYLDALDSDGGGAVADLDVLLCVSSFYDDYLVASALRAGVPTYAYVYSWDHPPKMTEISRRVRRYLGWNECIGEDMRSFHDLPPGQLGVVGSTQLALIEEWRRRPRAPRPFEGDYVYFACAIGVPTLVAEEVAGIHHLATTMAESAPGVRLVVRPYPFLPGWDAYESLRTLPNVMFDDAFRSGNGMAFDDRRFFERFDRIHYARALVHFGTTMGLEASYFDTPVLQLNYSVAPRRGRWSIRDFIAQHQNVRYLLRTGFPNVIADPGQLGPALASVLADPAPFLDYNRAVAADTPLLSIGEIADRLSAELLAAVPAAGRAATG